MIPAIFMFAVRTRLEEVDDDSHRPRMTARAELSARVHQGRDHGGCRHVGADLLPGGPAVRAQQRAGIRNFDHVSFPLQNTEAMLAFYRALGLQVNEGSQICMVHLGDQKINFHQPELWQQESFTMRAPAARPPCGDFCFVWEGSPESLTTLLDRVGAEVIAGQARARGVVRVGPSVAPAGTFVIPTATSWSSSSIPRRPAIPRRKATSRVPPSCPGARLTYWLPLGVLAVGLFACTAAPEEVAVSPPPEPAPATGNEVEVVGSVAQPSGGPRSIIILEPHTEHDVPVPQEPAQIDQYGRVFIPRLVVIREGQAVEFTNSEDELHNVHVIDEAGVSLVNVGMPILGGTFEHVFDKAGDYAVSCNVHQEMAAQIVVTKSPYAVIADPAGTFALSGIPAGLYDLVVRRGLERHERVVEIVAPVTELALDF